MIAENIFSSNITDGALKNETSLEERKKFILIRSFCFVLNILGIIGNGMLIHLLSCRIKRTRFTVYVLNITSADFLLIFTYFLDNAIALSATTNFMLLPFFQYITYLFGNDGSIYFLTVICVERYLMVFFPVWYQSHRPKRTTAFMCIILWTLCLTMMLWEYFSCHHKYYLIASDNCKNVLIIHFVNNFLTFICVMFFSTVALLIRIPKRLQENLPTRLDISIVAAVVRIIILWVPFKVVELLRLWIPHNYLPNHFVYMTISESIYGSACPYIYLCVGWWRSQKEQRSIHRLIERALTDREENTSMTTQEDQEQA